MFRNNHPGRLLAAAATVFVGAFPVLGGAQQTPATMAATVSAPAKALSRSDKLRQEAEALYSYNGPASSRAARFERIIGLRLDAARFAAADDPMKIDDLSAAGNVAAHLGRYAEAQTYLEQAAKAALDFGDLFQAGHAWWQAAVAAHYSGNEPAARDMLARAERVAQSRYLPADECDCLEQKVAAVRVAMANGTIPSRKW